MSDAGAPRLSVLIITRNAERMLDTVLESVRWADEIVVVDSGSTDATESIARRYTDRFFFHEYAGHGRQRQRTLEFATGDWILYIDSDEVVTPQLAASIRAAVAASRDMAGYRMQLHTLFMGKWFGKRGWRKEWKTRLFRRDRGHFDDQPIHEGAVIEGRIGTLDGTLLHYPYVDLAHLVEKTNQYSTAMADAGRVGAGASPAGAVWRGVVRFFRDYLLGGDFLYGGAGLIRSTTSGYYAFLKYAKAWEKSLPAAPPEGAGPGQRGDSSG